MLISITYMMYGIMFIVQCVVLLPIRNYWTLDVEQYKKTTSQCLHFILLILMIETYLNLFILAG